MFTAKFFAKDFKGGKIPPLANRGIVKQFMSMKNVEVFVEEVFPGGCFARLV